ncbi:MAG: phage/plasmid primase, P4 family [Labedaea sp.]
MHDITTQLSANHRRELLEGSAIDPAVIQERGYVTVERPNAALRDSYGRDTREQLKVMGFPGWAIREDFYYPGLLIPHYTPSGTRYAGQWKPFRAVPNREGKPMRYASAKGPSRLDVHPRWSIGNGELVPPILDPDRRLWITEGVKKADSLTSRGEITVALAGVYNWRGTHATLGDWEDVKLKGREVVICFDADAITKPHVAQAMARLGKWLRHKGATKVWYALPPGGPKGVDDYFASGGSLKDLEKAMTTRAPQVLADEDVFTDSALADLVANVVFEDQWCRTGALGWLRWNGRRWCSAEHGEVVEAVRTFFREQYAEALESDAEAVREGRTVDSGRTEGWRKVQSASKINAVLSLAGNIMGVLRDAGVFDADPDILNTPAGVLDLATGELMEHSPDHLCTKMTGAAYKPDANSVAWKAALDAVPEEALGWLQLRLGQALTGHQTDDGAMVLLDGGGNNGKTVIMGACYRALGDYARKIPNALLLKGKALGGPSEEKMTLRGTRLAYMEETPEDGHLDANTVKEILDAEVIEGRHLYKSTVEWTPSHSLFLNTNHPPHVTDTGDGTWRRLLRLHFPYRYRVNGQEIERPGDRLGDPTLKTAMAAQEAREAVLAWLVEGAQRWYAAGQTLASSEGHPAIVLEARQRWREASDDVLRYLQRECAFDPERWVSSDLLYQEYKRWATHEGGRAMSSREWSKRLTGHSALPGTVYAERVYSKREGVSWPSTWLGSTVLPERLHAIVGIRFQ